MDDALHRRRAEAGARLTEAPQRRPDVRVGSATDGLAPISVVRRPLGAGLSQWLALLAVERRGRRVAEVVVEHRLLADLVLQRPRVLVVDMAEGGDHALALL